MANKKYSELSSIYSDKFYITHFDTSFKSATKYAKYLYPLLKPRSIVDFGCGRCSWLFAFKKQGASTLIGYDGNWNSQEKMIDASIKFQSIDLNNPPNKPNKQFDLAMSLEVAEHLQPQSAKKFIKSLAAHSQVVLFSAAYTKQGGNNHINEQPHSYWARIFSNFGFYPFDLFREQFWGDADISYFYQQNTFLYVKRNSSFFKKLESLDIHPIQNIAFMDCIHPTLYLSKVNEINKRLKYRLKRLFRLIFH